ncbi:MAG: hypothetical protein OEZ07_02180 [Dehalococcoidia bacterium]|nr:hypothetical protein [Dehalococcoidia bacterium]
MTEEEEREQERLAQEELVREKIDEQGNKWRKVYFGGGEHFRNWLQQCRELGEVEVEEVDSKGFKCFEEGGEKLYRIWMKVGGESPIADLEAGEDSPK